MATKLRKTTFENNVIYMVRPTADALGLLDEMHKPTDDHDRMGLLIGDAGIGKTTAGRLFASKHRDVVYINLPPALAMKAPSAPVALMEGALGLAQTSRFVWPRLQALAHELIARPRTILLDTAHRLTYDQVDVFRFIHDEARIPVVILSVPALIPLFDRRPELNTRLRIFLKLKPATRDEIGELLPEFPADTVDDVYERTGGRMREVLQLARHMRNLKISPEKLTPEHTSRIARIFTVRTAA